MGTLLIGQSERFKALGQNHPTQAYFIRCSPDCEKFGELNLPEYVDLALASVGFRVEA